MQTLFKSKTLTVSIPQPVSKIYDFVSNLQNLPKWATTFAQSAECVDGEWMIQTERGPVKIEIALKNDYGILDHKVTAGDVKVYVPMRAVPNGDGCEITFTLFQSEGVPEEQFLEDVRMVEQDLATLKMIHSGSKK